MKTQSAERTRTIASIISNDEFLTTKELMRLLKVKHKQTIYKLVGDGMPAISVGKNYRFIKHEVIQFLKEASQMKGYKK